MALVGDKRADQFDLMSSAEASENRCLDTATKSCERSIIKQSYDARERRGDPSLPAHVAFGNLNADGFGIGWYLDQPERDPTPCVYTSITPAWNNENLARLATKVQSPLVFAHVRAAYPGMPVSEQNCHPFQWGRYCFMHNGIIGGFSRIKRRLIEQLSDDAFNTVQSFSSDSALSFAAFLNNLPCMTKPQPPEVLLVALQKVITTIVSLQQDAGVEDLSLLNYVISDGSTTIATRFVSPSTETAATLYYAEGSALCRTQPGSHLQPGQEVAKPTGSSSSVEGEGEYFLQFGERGTRVAVVASEPITGSLSDWVAVAPNTALVITRGKGGYVNIIRSPLASAGTHSRQEEVLRCLESVGQSLDVVSRPWQELGALHQTSSFVFAPSLAATRSPSSDDLSVGSNGPTSSAAQDDGSSNLVSREDHLINAHEKAVTSLVMDEKGVLYTSSVDCSIKAWDLQNITCLATMRGHRKPILKMQVLGRFLYSTAGRHIRVWSLETFRNVHSIQTPISSGHLLSVALAADGLVIAGSQDNSLKGFRTTQQQLSHTAAAPARLPPPPRPRGMAEGERRATAEPRGSAAPDATVLGSQLSYYRRPSVQAAAASASGAIPTGPYTMETTRSVARSSGCTQRRSPGEPSPAAANHPQAPSHAFTVAEPELSTTPEDGHLSEVKSIVVCGSFLCSAGGDAVIRVWDLGTFKPLRVLKGHRGVVLTLAAVRNLLLSGGRDNVVRVWDLDAMITRHCLLGHTDDILHITAIASGPEGHRVAFNGNSYGSLKNLAAAASEVPDSCPAGPCTAKKWSDYDGDPEIKQPALAASSSADSTVRIWSTICWTCVRILHVAPAANPSMPVLCTALSNKFAVTGGQDGKLRLWNLSDLYQNILRRGVCGLAGSDDDDDDCSLSGDAAGIVAEMDGWAAVEQVQPASCTCRDRNRGLPGCMSEGAEIVQGSSHQQSEAMHEASLAARAAGRLRRVNMVRLGSPPSPLQPPMESNNQLEHRLRDLVAIRTVSSDISLREECFHGAKYLAKVLESIGCEIKLYRPKEELNPVVLGRLGDVPDKPTITFYGHYDVQPAQEHDWCSNPFEMKAVDGFLYGRGTSDNKGPVLSFIYAVKELLQEGRRQSGGGGGAGGGGELPMNFAFIIEGEEENGSRGIREALEPNLRWFRNTQLIVISNSQWVGDSAPCLTCGMRGQINVSVRVAGPDRDLHSGNEGGVFNEPMSDLVKILDNLVDSRNTIRVPGFYDNTRENLVDAVMPGLEGFEQEFSVEGYQRALGVPGLTCGSSLRDLLEARWCRPSLSIVDLRMGHGMQVPSSPTSLLGQGLSTHDADADSMAALYRFGPTRYSVIPRSATGMLSIRFVPDQDPDHLVACLQDHITHQYRMLRSANHLDVQVKSVGHYWQVDTGCKLFRAAERAVEREWGVKPLHVMEGGTMPSARLLEQLLQAPALMLPLGQSSDNCHLANERIRRVNLYHGKNVFKHLIDEVAQLYERGELAS